MAANADVSVNEDYVAAWKDLKRRWRLCLFFFLGYVPIGGGIGIALSSLLQSDIPFVITGGAWFLAVPISDIYLFTFRCPRCKKHFFLKFGTPFQNPFKPRCVHCGISAGALTDAGSVEEDIAVINTRSRIRFRRSSLIGFSMCFLILISIAVATTVGTKRIAEPRMIAEQFLQQVQAHQYQQAHKLLAPQLQRQLKAQTLQQQWQTFGKAHGVTTKPKFLGTDGWPTTSVTLYYEIPDNKGGAEINLLVNNDAWQIESVTFYQNKTDMFPAKPTPHPTP